MFAVIQKIIYRIRTSYGDSYLTYGGYTLEAWKHYPQGILQGNTAGPDTWLALSSVMFEVLHKRGLGCKITTAISK